MTTTTTVLGPNSKTLLLDNDTQAGVISAISAVLVASGWEVWDQVSTINLVMRSKCYDGVNYKYLQLNCTTTTKLAVSVWESWNNSTHAGTNQAYLTTSVSTVTLAITMSACNITIFSSNRFAFFSVNNIVTNSIGVFEFIRDNPSETIAMGFPNFFIATYATLSTVGYTSGNSGALAADLGSNAGGTVGGVPRNRFGDTGAKAAVANALLSMNGMIGSESHYDCGTGYLSVSNGYNVKNEVANGQLLAATPIFIGTFSMWPAILKTGTAGLFDWRGRVFGLKMIPTNFGIYGDLTSVLCDSNGFSDPNGAAVDHFILGTVALPL